jgi:transposase, IS5 family
MRQRFEQQIAIGMTPISEVQLPLKSRDELPPVLKALQHIFVTPGLNENIFCLLEKKISVGKKKTGRKGMDLWHILVLAVVRNTLDTNWDRMEHIANYDLLTRKILGVSSHLFDTGEVEFSRQSIIDNVSLLDEELLVSINTIVAQYGHELLKKKGEENELRLKTDSFVLETNVHFPTDLNLLWDALRKCFDSIENLKKHTILKTWRKVKSIKKNTKVLYRAASQQVFGMGKKNPEQVLFTIKSYLKEAQKLQSRFEQTINTLHSNNLLINLYLEELQSYNTYVKKQIDLVDRRLIKEEIIAASEKVHSIFESHTEMIKKGKLHPNIELGHMILITTEQNNLIFDYSVMEDEKDAAQIKPLTERIQENFSNKKILSHSFDKGFYSKENLEILTKAGVANVILPKKGKPNKEEYSREHCQTFKTLRNKHSAIESNINMLEHHGLNRCPDKGIKGFKKYVGLSVLAYNLHIIGNFIVAKEKKKQKKNKKQRNRYHKQAA